MTELSTSGAPALGHRGLYVPGAPSLGGAGLSVPGEAAPPPETLTLSNATVADNAAAGTVIGTFTYPADCDPATLTLLYDEAGAFALSGNNLVVGSTLLTAGWAYQPIARIRSTATPYTYQLLTPDITVTAAWSPSMLTGYMTGWYAESGVTLSSGNQVSSWLSDTGVYTASQTPGTACPTLEPGYGPGGADLVKFDKAQLQFLNISPALPFAGGAIVAIYQPLDQTSTNKTLLGRSSGQFLWQASPTSVSLNMGTTRSIIPASAATLSSNRLSCLIVSHDIATGTASGEVDGVAAGSSGNAGTSATSFQMIGKHTTGNYGNYYLSCLFVVSAVPTADETARIQAWARTRRTTAWIFANGGDDANTGFTLAAAKADPMAWVSARSANGLRAGDRILMKGGDTFYGGITANAGLNLGQITKPIVFDRIGEGTLKVYGAPPTVLAWTVVTGDEWSAALARTNDPPLLWAYVDGDDADPVRIYNRATSQAQSFQYSAGTLTVNLGPGIDPNTVTIYVPKDANDQHFYGLGANHLKFRRIQFRHFLGQVFDPQSGNGAAIIQSEIGWCADDGVSPGGSNNGLAACCEIIATGRTRSTVSGAGDGLSVHGGSFSSQSNRFRLCGISGIRNEMGSNFTSEGDHIDDCNEPLRILYNASYPGPATQSFIGATIIRSVDDQQDDGLLIDANTTSAIAVNVTGCSFTGEGPVRGRAIRNAGSAVVTQSGNVQTGFVSLT